MKYYAGVGSRETPREVLMQMTMLARSLETLGYVLRSGGAKGADSAFAAGVKHTENKEIFLPWRGFNGVPDAECASYDVCRDAQHIARQHHPKYDELPKAAQKLISRNTYQVLGKTLDNPAEFVIGWTQGGTGKGGTGQAYRIAKAMDIPVFDLDVPEDRLKLSRLILDMKGDV